MLLECLVCPDWGGAGAAEQSSLPHGSQEAESIVTLLGFLCFLPSGSPAYGIVTYI